MSNPDIFEQQMSTEKYRERRKIKSIKINPR